VKRGGRKREKAKEEGARDEFLKGEQRGVQKGEEGEGENRSASH